MIPRASECFFGCGRRPEGSGQLASNLLSWEMNEQISALIKPAILFDALHPNRYRPTRSISLVYVEDGEVKWSYASPTRSRFPAPT